MPTLVSSTLPELLDDGGRVGVRRGRDRAAAGLRTGVRCAGARWTGAGDPARLLEIAATARAVDGSEGDWLAEHEAKALLAAHGVAVPAGGWSRTRTTLSGALA